MMPSFRGLRVLGPLGGERHRVVLAACVLGFAIAVAAPLDARRHAPRTTRSAAVVREKRSELARLRLQIASYETRLRQLERTEHSSVQRLDAVSAQVQLLRRLIARLNDQEARLERDIDATAQEIGSSERRLTALRAEYARAVVGLYMRGRESDWELLLTAHSVGEVVARGEYLRRFSDNRARLLENITATVTTLRAQRATLTEAREEKSAAVVEKQAQQDRLARQMAARSQLVDRIRHDKASLRETLDRARRSSKAIEGLIARLVARDRARTAVAARTPSRAGREGDEAVRARASDPVPVATGGFGALRGALRWPCAGHRIVERFGEHTNPDLGTVTVNPGVDIRTNHNAAVNAVADGAVSLVYWLPSFGTIVILDHAGGYRTVYANLADVLVRQGERVAAGGILGHSDLSPEAGEMVHFEIWHDRDKLDPENWLRR